VTSSGRGRAVRRSPGAESGDGVDALLDPRQRLDVAPIEGKLLSVDGIASRLVAELRDLRRADERRGGHTASVNSRSSSLDRRGRIGNSASTSALAFRIDFTSTVTK
jgi:hypothetical protein